MLFRYAKSEGIIVCHNLECKLCKDDPIFVFAFILYERGVPKFVLVALTSYDTQLIVVSVCGLPGRN